MEHKRKPYRLPGNIAFVAQRIWRWDKAVLPIYIAGIPCRVLPPMIVLFLPTILLRQIEAGVSPAQLVFTVAGITAASVLLNFGQGRLWRAGDLKNAAISRRFDLLLSEKIMDMDFELAEGPLGREKYQKAKNSLDHNGVYEYLGTLAGLLTDLFGILSFAGVIAMLNPLVILILLAAEGLQFLVEIWQRRLEDRSKDVRAGVDRKLGYIRKTTRDFAIAKDIRLFRMEAPLRRMSEYFVGEKKFWTNRVYLTYFLTDGSSELILALLRCGIYFYLINELLKGLIDIPAFVLYLGSVLGFAGWIKGINQNLDNLLTANLCVRDVRAFLDIPNQMNCGEGPPLPQTRPLGIELRGVSYTYPGAETPALRDVNLTIKPGERLAIVGRNGAGKTTLVKMLCGLYRPGEGQVLAGGTDVAQFNRDAYYALLSCVFQEIRVMPVSVACNVSMQLDGQTDLARAEECLRLAGLWDKIASLPLGIQTPLVKSVNDDGVELSGGELQRLALARAVYKDAPVLILDEPTAALDAIAENEMYLQYSALAQNKTSVYISHRLSSTRFCDRIVYLEDGEIIETGSHDALMALGGKYAAMFAVQSQYYQAEALREEADV